MPPIISPLEQHLMAFDQKITRLNRIDVVNPTLKAIHLTISTINRSRLGNRNNEH